MLKFPRPLVPLLALAALLSACAAPTRATAAPAATAPATQPSLLSPREAAKTAAQTAQEARAHFDALADSSAPKVILATKPAKAVEATLTQTITIPDCRVDKWVLFAARPVDTPGQRHVEWAMDPPAKESQEWGPQRRPVLAARLAVKEGKNEENRHAVTVRLTYKAELMSRDLKPREAASEAPAVEPPAKRERASALAATTTFDFDSPEFQDWLDHEMLRPGEGETEMDFATRAFRWVTRSCRYEYTGDMDRKASHVCAGRKSDCGGLSALLVSALRANGIPARQLVGRWAMSEKPGEKVGEVEYHQQHAKCEFFAAGVGWVPADPSSAVLWDKTADGLAFFGHDAGDFLAFHYDDDFRLRTVLFGTQKLPYLQQVGFWVAGDGSVDGLKYETKWEVKEVAAQAGTR